MPSLLRDRVAACSGIDSYAHARTHLAWREVGQAARRRFRGTAGERGQGTVEYVGLILLVSLLMVGMVAAMKGFNESFG